MTTQRVTMLSSKILDETVSRALAGKTPEKAVVNSTLNTALRNSLSTGLAGANLPALANLMAKMPSADMARAKGLSIQAFVKQQIKSLVARKPALKRAVAKEVAQLSITTTVGAALGLDQIVGQNPLFAGAVQSAQLGSLVAATPGLSKTLQTNFVNLYTSHQGTIQDFWSGLKTNKQFAAVVPQIQLTLQLGMLTLNNASLVGALRSKFQPATVRDLAKLDAPALAQVILSANVSIPAGIPGANPTEQAANYAQAMVGLLTAAFPTDYVAKGLAASTDKANQGVARFLGHARDFDLGSTQIDKYLQQNSVTAFQGIGQDQIAEVTAQVKAVQRVFHLNPDADVITTLLSHGLDSAHKIVSVPPAVFQRQYGASLGGPAQAFAIYQSAEQVAGLIAILKQGVQQADPSFSPQAIGGPSSDGNATSGSAQTLTENIPNWQSLFGATSSCQCQECGALDGPAAYFVNLLEFLRNGSPNDPVDTNAAGFTPLDVLIGYQNNPSNAGNALPPNAPAGRRPDLAYLKLNCENTDTALPYVDLVNEIMETFVAQNGALPSSSNNTPSDATSDELSVNPEYTVDAAYTVLAQASYPLVLPYDRFLETARNYLNFLGSSRFQVLQGFGPLPVVAQPNTSPVQPTALASEYLKLSEFEYGLITGEDFNGQPFDLAGVPYPSCVANTPYQLYGYSAATVPQAGAGNNPAPPPVPWSECLAQVPEFLRRTGIAYADLVSLIETQQLNPGFTLTLQINGSDLCDLTQTTIAAPSQAGLLSFFASIPPFLRLWRKVGWSIPELDQAVRLFQGAGRLTIVAPSGVIAAGTVLALSQVKQLQDCLKLPIGRLLSLWGGIGPDGRPPSGTIPDVRTWGGILVDGRDSIYQALFQNRAVTAPVDPAFALRLSAPLAALPAIVFPGTLNGLVSYDGSAQQLSFIGKMSDDTRALLAGLSSDPSYLAAVDHLYNMRPLADPRLAVEAGPVAPPPAPAFVSSEAISSHANTILAALRISADDLAAIGSDAGIDVVGGTLNLTLGNLSTLYRYATLAQAFGLAVEDFISLRVLTGLPLAGAADGATVTYSLTQLAAIAPAVANSKFSIAQLNYLYRGISDPANGIGPLQSDEDVLIVDLLAGLQKIAAANTPAGVQLGTAGRNLAKQALSQSVGIDPVLTALLLEGAPDGSVSALLASQADPTQPAIVDFLGGLAATYFSDTALAAAVKTQVDPGVDLDGTQTISFGSVRWTGSISPPQTDNYTFSAQANGGQTQLWIDGQLVLDTASPPPVPIALTAGQLYDIRLEYTHAPAAAAIQLQWISLQTPVLAAVPATALATSGIFPTLSLLHRIATMVKGFGMKADEVAYLSAHGGDFSGPDSNHNPVPFTLTALPDDGSLSPQASLDQNAVPLFNQWRRLNALYTLQSGLPAGNTSLFDIFQAADSSVGGNSGPAAISPPVLQAILDATGWNQTDLIALVGTPNFDLSDPSFKSEIPLLRLAACLGLGSRLGLSCEQLVTWASNAPDPSQAQDIKNTVKAKYDDDTWMQVGKPLNDKLRESSKQALIAYILTMDPIQKNGTTDANGLYEYFLIDVQMTPCMETSRIVQAAAAVQLFVQRCLMNLENNNGVHPELNVPPSAIDAQEWNTWRKNYRVWQAAVEVFLYPENWIQPELRDDKTPFFSDLETELLQGAVTTDRVETAYFNYLEKLHDVARLDMAGIYLETDSDPDTSAPIDLTHLFGRSFTSPHVYFYRCRNNRTGVWTAWEKVGVEIQGDQLIPMVWDHRLYLFWPIYKETSDPVSQSPQSTAVVSSGGTSTVPAPSPALKRLEVRLGWSECRQGSWTKKQATPDSDPLVPVLSDSQGNLSSGPDYDFTLDTSQFMYSAAVDQDGDLIVTMSQVLPSDLGNPTAGGTYYALGSFTFTGSKGITPGPNPSPWSPDVPWPLNWGADNMDVIGFSSVANGMDVLQGSSPLRLNIRNEGFGYGAGSYALDVLDLNPAFPTFDSTLGSSYSLLFPQQLALDFSLSSFAPYLMFQDTQHTYFVTKLATGIVIQMQNPDNITLLHETPLEANAGSLFHPGLPLLQENAGAVAASPVGGAGLVAQEAAPVAGTGSLSAISETPLLPYFGYSSHQNAVQFFAHDHPHVGDFIQIINWKGIPGLLSLGTQQLGSTEDSPDQNGLFYQNYGPTQAVTMPYPSKLVDFTSDGTGAYSLYNWELFFHIPLLIATSLSRNQQFEDAQTWFHYIFNPTNDAPQTSSPQRYWNFLPFRTSPDETLADILNSLLNPGDPESADASSQVAQWRQDPFDPDLLARLRPAAYQKAVVMKYLDNLIAWGDFLFGQDTRESINEATQIYVLAQQILGDRPVTIPAPGTTTDYTYRQLAASASGLDALGNANVQLENTFPFNVDQTASANGTGGASLAASIASTPYFCTPANSTLLGYWDTVADRLFKIRRCMNLQGQAQQLPLFAPPINPALLIAAAAGGIDLSSALNDIATATPCYRFSSMLPKALELCAEVRSLGGALLSALEKADAEALSQLRAGQETAVLKAARQTKQRQIDEAQANQDGLAITKDVTASRQAYYQGLVAAGLSLYEGGQIAALTVSQAYKLLGEFAELFGAEVSMLPQIQMGVSGFGGTPAVNASLGSQQLTAAASATARTFSIGADMFSFIASMANLMGGWDRRSQEWKFQLQTATLELTQIQKQIDAAGIRIQIAEQELASHDLQIDNASAVADFLLTKYTGQDLYNWMVDQVSAVYFQCYQLAYYLAKQAEACFRFERGLGSSNFIQFGYWDSLKKGLLSGERLYLDLKRLETAYLDQNKRDYEITKNISLVLLDPLALIALKETGQCLVNIPEAYFDVDYPGHFMRRVKSLGLTIPCVTGPYTSVNCTVTLLESKVRWDPSGPGYAEAPAGADGRFFYNFSATQSIATSTAQNDSGMFEVNFRDERYLPFEGAGAIAQWRIYMPPECNAFDFETITDVILNLKYTARDGGAAFAGLAAGAAALPPAQVQSGVGYQPLGYQPQSDQLRYFSLKHEFPTEWYQFMNPSVPASAQTNQVLSFALGMERFPFRYRGKSISITQMEVFLKFDDHYPTPAAPIPTPADDFGLTPLPLTLTPPSGASSSHTFTPNQTFGKVPYFSAPGLSVPAGISPWTLGVASSDVLSLSAGLQSGAVPGQGSYLNPQVIDDIMIVCHFNAV